MLTVKNIRQAVKVLKRNAVEPVDGMYRARIGLQTVVDILLTYKRPKTTRLYRLFIKGR